MKILINSSNVIRDNWTNLVVSEKNDKIHCNNGHIDWYEGTTAGQYYIESQVNKSNAPVWHKRITDEQANELMKMDIEDSIDKMARLVAP
ncbi:MAG TPA: hypothetical protein VIK78_14565 [Ruminiclostridium sp.]